MRKILLILVASFWISFAVYANSDKQLDPGTIESFTYYCGYWLHHPAHTPNRRELAAQRGSGMTGDEHISITYYVDCDLDKLYALQIRKE